MVNTLIKLGLILLALNLTHFGHADDHSKKGAVLITGATSGSGLALAERLAKSGVYVFAGARKDKDMEMLNKIPNVEAVRLDVTVDEHIQKAVEQVKASGRPLHGVVNNAGVGLMAPLIELKESDLKFILNVNAYGPYRVTKAFAPMLIESKGRVVTIGSIAGFQSRGFYGPYSMSKHMAEAYSDSLAREMNKFGVKVSMVEPGGFRSDIGKNIFNRLQKKGMDFKGSLYEQEWQSNWVLQGGDLDNVPNIMGPDEVAKVAEHALYSDTPKPRYMIIGDAGRQQATTDTILARVAAMNASSNHPFTRDELIKILDEELDRIESIAPSKAKSDAKESK